MAHAAMICPLCDQSVKRGEHHDCTKEELPETPKQYLARIGSEGGKKSRRKLTKKDAKAMALKRWGKK